MGRDFRAPDVPFQFQIPQSLKLFYEVEKILFRIDKNIFESIVYNKNYIFRSLNGCF